MLPYAAGVAYGGSTAWSGASGHSSLRRLSSVDWLDMIMSNGACLGQLKR
jgi:hypothetical protein